MNDFLGKSSESLPLKSNEKPTSNLESKKNKLALYYLSGEIGAEMTLVDAGADNVRVFNVASDKEGKLDKLVKKVIDNSLVDGEGYSAAIKGMKNMVKTLTPEEFAAFKPQYEFMVSIAKRKQINTAILTSRVLSANPKMKQALLDQTDLFTEEFREGRMSREEYLEELDAVHKQVVANVPEDKELKQVIAAYQAVETSYDSTIYNFDSKEAQMAQAAANNDVPIVEEKAVAQAFNELKAGGIKFDAGNDNTAKVICGNEFEVKVSVYRNATTNNPVYYIADKYSEDGFVRVEEDKLLETVDDRYVDSYLTTKSADFFPKAKETLNAVPDEKLINLAKKIIGNGEKRHGEIEGDNRVILDNFVRILNAVDADLPNFEKKIQALEIFMSNEENVDALRKRLVKEGSISALTVSEIVGPVQH
ncbi:MAG: hypothetical protein AAB373_05815 [Patescibacteria group bacterium]